MIYAEPRMIKSKSSIWFSLNREHRAAQLLLRLWPFARGTGRIVDRLFSKLDFKAKREMVSTTEGFFMEVYPRDLVGRHIYLTGAFDRTIIELLLDFAQQGDQLLDVGANVGYVSCCFLHNVSGAMVYAVEPQKNIVELLTPNLARLGQFKIYPYALGDRDAEANFDVTPANSGAGRLAETGTLTVKMKPAAQIFDDLEIRKLDIVKIDAEGAEEQILSNSATRLAQLQPRVILYESSNREGCQKILESIGYKVFGIEKRLSRIRLVELSGHQDRNFHDCLAISKKRELPETAMQKYKLETAGAL